MRHNYVGDIGDYYKYALLRRICRETGKKLGVVWCLYEDECNPADGKYLHYLESKNHDKYRPVDPELYDQLAALIADDARHIHEIRKRGILPTSTSFYEEPLNLSDLPKATPAAIKQRIKRREQWLQGALDATREADIVFFDPDNGLEIQSTQFHHDKGPKFTFYRELKPFWDRGQSLIIYQHKTRQGSFDAQLQRRVEELKAHLHHADEIQIHKAGGDRAFLHVKTS